MKLLTLNCHSWQEENQIEKIEILARAIIKNDYDVVCLQEVSQRINSKIEYENIKEDNYGLLLLKKIKILGGVKYDFFWDFSHIGYDIYEEGLCILTKKKMKKKESFFITNSEEKENWKARKILRGRVDDIDIYSCHLGWFEDKDEPFKEQVEKMMKKVERKSIFMGDFNNNGFIEGFGYTMLKSYGLVDTYDMAIEKDNGVTVEEEIAGWTENKEKLRIDMIFLTEKMEVLRSRTIFNEINEEKISDHYGIEVEIKR